MEKVDVGIVVIALNGKIRNKSQIDSRFLSKFSQFEILESITPVDLSCQSQNINHHHFKGLTCVERAASVSHQVARNIASTFDTDWVIIMEDDAVINKNFFAFLHEITSSSVFKVKNPIGFHLFPEQFGILKKISANIARVLMIPDYAVAYILNGPALKLSMDSSVKCTRFLADWPKFLKNIHWFAPLKSTVFHPEVNPMSDFDSSIHSSRIYRLSKLNKFHIYYKFRRMIIMIFSLFFKELGTAKINAPKLRSRCL